MEMRSKYLKEVVKDSLSLRWSRVLNGFTFWSNLSNMWTWATSSTHSSTTHRNTHPGIQQRTPCPQVADIPVKERNVNDYSLQWGRKHGGCRNNDKDKQLNQGWRRGSQGELEEKGRVFQVKEAAMMLREMGKSEQSIMACFKFFSPQ